MKTNIPANLLFILLMSSSGISAQSMNDLFIPYEIQQAYENGTRSTEGIPGRNYFQSRTDYAIKTEFFPETNLLTGTETITFKHNGRDTLSNIYLNLYQNLYKKGTPGNLTIDAANIHEGVEITSVKVNGIPLNLNSLNFFSTILHLHSPEKIAPGSETSIELDWRQIMPVTAVKRQGTYNKTSFFIAYWYPKLCVFDDIEGWNVAGHKGTAEFYSDYGNFDVEITVPAEYIVWSSGELQNSSEIFTEKFIDRIRQASQSDTVVHIITAADRIENRITKPAIKHQWKFKSENQTDFAFALSDSYLWDGTSINTGNKVIPVNSVYYETAETFSTVAEISRKSIDFYVNKIPGIAFPFQHLTAFQGSPGGMEFPGMINDQDFDNAMETILVTSHEIGHAWFPFNVGINEEKYGWMDEGLTTYIGLAAFSEQIGDKDLSIFKEAFKRYKQKAGSQTADVPLMIVSYALSDETAGFSTYVKPICAFYLLAEYMGKDKFYQAIRLFTERWQGKHPIPYDLFYTFNETAGEDLAWFWKPWFFEFGYADLAIGAIDKVENFVTIVNKGSYPMPIILTVRYHDGTEETISRGMDIWKDGIKSCNFNLRPDIKEIILNNPMIPEASYDNNHIVIEL
ncbi:MAG: M1 family metallopeptidase [Lentimicrobium sp.]|nr:M1 family metallopeptidase [Lentimicrobium sp.]